MSLLTLWYKGRNSFAFLNPNLSQTSVRRTCRIMKLVVLLMTVACLHAGARGFAQITLSETDVPIRKVFDQIEKQTGYLFWYTNAALQRARPVSVHVQNADLRKVLDICFAGQPLTYNIVDKVIVINAAKQDAPLSSPPLPAPVDVQGIVTDESGKPLEGASVQIKGTSRGTYSDASGRFTLKDVTPDAVLVIQFTGYTSREIQLSGPTFITCKLSIDVRSLEDVSVEVSTGYQTLPRERATGSFEHINSRLLNRAVSTNILDRLQGVASGVLFQGKTDDPLKNIQIRSRTTIFATDYPLVILDNFEYTGDISNINPNDIESVTILKDAAAASIWGAKSGNGVIVLTSKSGKYNKPASVSFNSNITFSNQPEFLSPTLGSRDYIEAETYLFEKGYYNTSISSVSKPALTPVVEILLRQRNGQLSAADAQAQIQALGNYDVRDDLEKYYTRRRVKQQYAISLSGGNQNNKYYLSVGYDKNNQEQIGNAYRRLTVNANQTYAMLKNKLEISTGVLYTGTHVENNYNVPVFGSGAMIYPYAQLADQNGNSLPVARLRTGFVDTAGAGKLFNWYYKPLDERNYTDNRTATSDYRVNLGIKYKVTSGLDIDIKYQYGKGLVEQRNLWTAESYYVRDLINQYSAVNWSTGLVTRPVPSGDILDFTNTTYVSQNLRSQVNYNKAWNKSLLTAIGGLQVQDVSTDGISDRFYGYDEQHASSVPVDYTNSYRSYVNGASIKIYNNQKISFLSDRFVSYYTNVAYSYNNKYILSGSVRKDASNLFGVRSNQKGIPLWSAGGAWNVSNEPFYQVKGIPYLKVRATYGYNGNLDKTITAFLVTKTLGSVNLYNALYSSVNSPPNPELRWEKSGILNLAVEFKTQGNKLSGTIEYYNKKGTDLIGNAPLDPTTGLASYKGNTANMKSKGFDIMLSSNNIARQLKWSTVFLFSYAKDWVTDYKMQSNTIVSYINTNTNPIVGRPVNSVYSFRWAGLDPLTGDPQGIFNKQTSKDYAGILNSANRDDLIYNGPATPTFFGGLRNTFSWKNLELSFNITYKLGYYFRKSTTGTNYADGISGTPHSDFSKRWKKPGDELTTSVPSAVYPANTNRSNFYRYAEILVDKGDQIRFQDISFSYLLDGKAGKRLPFRDIRIYFYGYNLGLLWKANRFGLDPDLGMNPSFAAAAVKNFSIGISANF